MRDLPTLSRRGFLAGTAALGATTLLSSCGYTEENPTGAGGPTWTFTDDRGRKLDGPRPARIVAQVTAAAALWDFGIRPIAVFGPSKLPDGKPDPQVGGVDLNAVTSLGNVWNEFNFDKFASLDPQLLVTVIYLKQQMWYVPDTQADRVDKTAPSVGIGLQGISMPEGIAKFAALARALGADTDSPAIRQARQEFERADAALGEAIKKAAGLRVLLLSAQKDTCYVANPTAFATSRHYQNKGVRFVLPEKPDTADGGYYEQVSWENIGKYEADVILYDARGGSLSLGPDGLGNVPTWRQLPAVRAGRLVPWNNETPLSYQRFTPELTALTSALHRFA
ncbi:iron complex transport system substrate-binding protein [Herbihabitans rhizosphaerae]|uniref:Iron complex transport system substrate-binding protein n=1 Tax=Herbihabitans rhizosphaerae TaxID=1872711 RepID=A0A4Q7KEQ7_9PSEU|nr:ABC transporter substrate-binding protein [Herbihabitans rhizosphaerae]RZS31340.1 iron complex transport system substrate-binding protein [Herbihabitans rhizosphaerae]